MTVVEQRSEVLQELGQSFKRTMAALRRMRGRETHRPGELSYAQYSLLFGLAAGGELSAGELASSADLSPGTVTQMLDGLAAAGLVERVRSQRDKRVVLVSLTDRGESVVAARRARLEPLWEEALSEFSERELATASAVLDRLHELFEQMADDPQLEKGAPRT
jgi:DNA-binding MarR family transcriptional regulator